MRRASRRVQTRLVSAGLVGAPCGRRRGARAAQLGFASPFQGRLLPALVHRLEGGIRIRPERRAAMQLRQFAGELAPAADDLLGEVRLILSGRPVAEPDHLFEDDLVLRALADAVVELLPGERAGLDAHGRRARTGGQMRDAGRKAFVKSRDWSGPLDAGTTPTARLGSRNPNRKRAVGVCAGPVKSGPVTLCRAGCRDGETPPRLQGPLRPTSLRG